MQTHVNANVSGVAAGSPPVVTRGGGGAAWASTVAIGLGVGLVVAAPAPGPALRTLRLTFASTPAAGDDLTVAVVALAALVAWGLAGWLVGAAGLTACSYLPGAAGRLTGALALRVTPHAVRRVLDVALGLSIATGVCAGPAAASYAGAGSGPPPADVPASAPIASAPVLDWPTAPPAGAAEHVVVTPGDTLWGLAERSLGGGATAAQVAQTWPAWWDANRDVIGPDPDLLHPGTRLTPPPAHDR